MTLVSCSVKTRSWVNYRDPNPLKDSSYLCLPPSMPSDAWSFHHPELITKSIMIVIMATSKGFTQPSIVFEMKQMAYSWSNIIFSEGVSSWVIAAGQRTYSVIEVGVESHWHQHTKLGILLQDHLTGFWNCLLMHTLPLFDHFFYSLGAIFTTHQSATGTVSPLYSSRAKESDLGGWPLAGIRDRVT